MGGAIGEWSNSAPRAEPCHWATWVAPIFSEHPKPDHQSLWWTFPLAPLAPPLPPPGPRTHCRQIPGTQAPPAGRPGPTRPISTLLTLLAPSPPLAPPGPPWPPLAVPGRPWPPLAPPGLPSGRPWPPALAALFGGREVPALRPRQRWELRAPALNPKR